MYFVGLNFLISKKIKLKDESGREIDNMGTLDAPNMP